MKNKGKRRRHIVTAMIAGVILFGAFTTFAAEGDVLTIQAPEAVYTNISTDFEVIIQVDEVADFSGISLDMVFDPEMVTVNSVTLNPLLFGDQQDRVDDTFVNFIDNVSGTINYCAFLTGDGAGVDISTLTDAVTLSCSAGTKAGYWNIETTNDGLEDLSLDGTNTRILLSDSNAQQIDSNVPDTTIRICKSTHLFLTANSALEAGETVTFEPIIAGIPESQTVDFRLLYATDALTYDTVPGYGRQEWPESGISELSWTLPESTKDISYTFVLESRTSEGSVELSDPVEVMAYCKMPLENVELTIDGLFDSIIVQDSTGIYLTANPTQKSGYESNDVTYRFLYKLSTSSKWIAVSGAYVVGNEANFVLNKEDMYDFKVEARTTGRAVVDVEDTAEQVTVYFNALPAEGLTLAVTDGETQFLSTETVPLEITAIGNGEDDMEYLVEFSTNGKSYKPLIKGEAWHAFVPNSGDTMLVDQTLPAIKKDTLLYIRASVRSAGRTTVDAYDVTTVNAYMVMPLASVTLDSVGDTTVGQAVPEGGITLTATATNQAGYAETPTYRFAYRMEGSTKWVYIG